MPTRFYYRANTAAPCSPAFDASWSSTTGAVRRRVQTAQESTTETTSGSLSGAGGDSTLAVQLISPPLSGAQTISGTWSATSRGRELDVLDNVDKRYRVAKVVSNDGSTVRGTLVSFSSTTSAAELGTSFSGQAHANAGGLTSVSALDGDRIVVELGYGSDVAGTSPQFEMMLGGTGTDHPSSANNDTTGSVPWFEISGTPTFKSEQVHTATASGASITVGSTPGRAILRPNATGASITSGSAAASLVTIVRQASAHGSSLTAGTAAASLIEGPVKQVGAHGAALSAGAAAATSFKVLSWFFSPPTVMEAPIGNRERLWEFYSLARGISVIKKGSVYTQGRWFTQDEIAAADKYYQGGRRHGPLSDAERDELVAAGYEAFLVLEKP